MFDMSESMEVGKKLVEFCKAGKNEEGIKALYSDKIVSIEAMGGPDMPARQEGIEAVKGKNKWWLANHEVHSSEVMGPWPHGDRFAVRFVMDVTAKGGPMAGKRMNLDEIALYTVKDSKIVQEEFFYNAGQ
jgi:hypothetical protein